MQEHPQHAWLLFMAMGTMCVHLHQEKRYQESDHTTLPQSSKVEVTRDDPVLDNLGYLQKIAQLGSLMFHPLCRDGFFSPFILFTL